MTVAASGGRRAWRRGLAGVVALALLGAACGDDSSEQETEGEVQFEEPSSVEPVTDDLDIEVPDGWRAVPLDQLAFGLALPDDWQDTLLDEAVLDMLAEASPSVPGFIDRARTSYQQGAVFYAAGTNPDDPDQVTDLKVRVGVDLVEGEDELEERAEARVAEGGLDEADVEAVSDWRFPAVDMTYRIEDTEDGEGITTWGVDRFVLAPSGAVYEVIVTGEDEATVDSVTEEIFATLDFADVAAEP